MNRKELAAALAGKTGVTKANADRNVQALIEIISSTLEKGGKVALSGFGSFEVRERAARTGRNECARSCGQLQEGSAIWRRALR